MENLCGLCGQQATGAIYAPERSTRGLTVHLCRNCGLLQSLPRIDRAPRRGPAVSSGADWGNVRYGKAFRTKPMLEALARHADLSAPLSLLDVGSNRGSFARAFLDAAPAAHLVALEPDERVAQSCKDIPRSELIEARIEDVALETGRFDIVHSCHTIEHLADPAAVLSDHWRVLKPGGLLVIEAPNIAFLNAGDVVEEWFIDKHLYHFSAKTLTHMIEAAGFAILEAPDPRDQDNLSIVARKAEKPGGHITQDPAEVAMVQELLASYVGTRARNLVLLTSMATKIATMKQRGIAMWGAGRIFDSLVIHGGFDPRDLSLLIDTHLKKHMAERHGCALHAPESLGGSEAGVVIIMSRSFAPEIEAEAKRLAPGAEILLYSDLLAETRRKLAA